MSETSCIEAVGLGKAYWDGTRNLEILSQVFLDVKKGEGVAILGPSGSGKTTLLNLLSGIDRPTQGRVRLEGVWLDELDEDGRSEIRNLKTGFVFQFYHLLQEFTAFENVMLPALMRKERLPVQKIYQRASALLERVGLKERLRHFPSQLSGGEQQRVAIARALVNDPAILFCDEPTGNLDAQTGSQIIALLRSLFCGDNKTVVVVTHDERIAQAADRVWDIVTGQWNENHAIV